MFALLNTGIDLSEMLSIIGKGYGGVFAVTIVIILMVKLLTFAMKK